MSGTRRAPALAVLALVGACLVLAGCETSPLGPGNTAQSASMAPPVVALAPDGTVDYVWAPMDTAHAESVGTVSPLPRSESGSTRIDGSRGGAVHAGRFSLKVPAGAFDGIATVTLSMPDSTVMVCDLSITPASANRFKVPVQLIADLSSTDITDISTLTMYWYDPSRVTWVNCSSKSRSMGTLVTMGLDHFSRYAAGKAGW